ncbi:MAG: AMIN domain-containing protein, partial [Thermoanaerobaculia bacterium]
MARSSEPVPPAAAPAALPATISRLAIMEGAPGTRIDIVADSALVWTTYRDADGALVIELPNTRPLEGVHAEKPPAGLVSSVAVSVDETSGRPLTRLTVQTRQDAEHTLVAGQNSLHIDLTPAGVQRAQTSAPPTPAAATLASSRAESPAAPEPYVPAALPLAAAAAAAPATSLANLGTPDRPVIAPPPTGALASVLGSVDVISEGAATVVRIAGDGEFAYSTFLLANPDRFVIDLDGVVNQSARSSAPLEGAILARIRVSQFKKSPEAVSRVVFDLRQTVPPTIERGPEGLLVRFGAAAVIASRAPERSEPSEPAESVQTIATVRPAAEPVVEPAVDPAREPMPEETQAASVETFAASDVQAYAELETAAAVQAPVASAASLSPPSPVIALPAAAHSPAPASPIVDFAAKSVTPRDTSLYEAADTQVMDAPRPSAAPSPAFAQQTVGGTHKEYVGETISLSLKDGDIKDVLRSFAKISGLNVVVQPGVRGTVTVELESVPWDQALDQILKINNLGYELDGNIMRIAPRNVLEAEAKEQQALAQAQALSIPLRTVIKRISYSSVGD